MPGKLRTGGLVALALCAGQLLTGCVHTQTVAPDVVIVTEPQRATVNYRPAPSPWGDPARRYSRSLGGAFVPWYPYPYPVFHAPRHGFAYGWPWTTSYAGWPGPYFPPGRWTYYPWYGWSPLSAGPWPGAWQAAAVNDPRYVYEPPFQVDRDVLPVAYARPIYRSDNGQRVPYRQASGLRTTPGAISIRQFEDFRAYRSPASPGLSNSAFRRPEVSGPTGSSASSVRSAGRSKPGVSRTHSPSLRIPSTSSSRASSPASSRTRSPQSAPTSRAASRVPSLPDR
jgi:hypothetical protein